MKVLVYGAGVIGTLYATRLQQAGHQVTILGRGSRLLDIQHHGLIIQDITTGARSVAKVAVTDRLSNNEEYDFGLVAVRRDQLPAVVPDLAKSKLIPSILFMQNNPFGSAALTDFIEADRVLLGFPGAGGALEDGVVQYAMIAQQPTTLGEPTGKQTRRLQVLVDALHASGVPTRVDNNMNAWLVCHAFFITSVCGAIYLASGDCQRLSCNPALLTSMIYGVREGFRVVRELGQPIHPASLRALFMYVPRAFAAGYWRRFFSRPIAEFIFARHARHAAGEMEMLATDCRVLLGKSGISAPTFRRLCNAIENWAQVPNL